MHFHISASGIEHAVSTIGSKIGGCVGNVMEAGSDGFKTYEDIRGHQWGSAVEDGVETLYHGAEAVVDGLAGDFF